MRIEKMRNQSPSSTNAEKYSIEQAATIANSDSNDFHHHKASEDSKKKFRRNLNEINQVGWSDPKKMFE